MKNLILLATAVGCLSISASAQTTGRTFDNFDTLSGVQIEKPPGPPAPVLNAKATKRLKNGRWVSVRQDKLVKKTGKSSPVMAVQDSLALREPMAGGTSTKLAMSGNLHLKGFTTGNAVYDTYIVDSSRRYNIDPLLIYAQMHQESTFKTFATSHKGASGLMQLMPATARRFGVTKIYDPRQNIEAGVRYMRWLIDTFNGNVTLALAGYNAGEGAVMKYGWHIPPYRETQEYVRRISSRYNSISDGKYVHNARPASRSQVADLENASRPLTVYEPDPLAVKMPGGNMMLVNQ